MNITVAAPSGSASSVKKTNVPLGTDTLGALEKVSKPVAIDTPQGGVSIPANTLVVKTGKDAAVTFKMDNTSTESTVETYDVGFYKGENEVKIEKLPTNTITLTFKTSFTQGDKVIVRCGEEAYSATVGVGGVVTVPVTHLSTWTITKVDAPTVTYLNSTDVTGTADAKYFYGKLTISGLTDGHYYLVVLNSGNVVSGGKRANICLLEQPSSGSIVIPCQSGLNLKLYDVTKGDSFEIPANFTVEQALIGFGSDGVLVDTYRAAD